MTVTPAALTESPEKLVGWLDNMSSHRAADGRPDRFAWAPVSYVLEGGALSTSTASHADSKAKMHNRAVYALHLAAQRDIVALTSPFPSTRGAFHEPTTGFPRKKDRLEYDQRQWRTVERWLPPCAWAKDLETLLKDVGVFKREYVQMRRWIVVATREECERFRGWPEEGIEVCTFDETADLFVDAS